LTHRLPDGTPLVYIDECGVERHVVRKRARAPRGQRVVVKRPGKREKRLNVTAGLCGNEVIAPVVYDWTTKHTWFEVWFEWHLCPNLRLNSVIIMDNASWHRKSALEAIAKFYSYHIIWLPTYSPDKNRIEPLWANLKFWLQYNVKNYSSLHEAILHFFQPD